MLYVHFGATRIPHASTWRSSLRIAETFDSGVLYPPDGDPRPVSRGSNLRAIFLGLDSLYVVLEYPLKDVYLRWSESVADLHDVRLAAGIPVDEYVIRRGGLGYKLSVWDGDARLWITDRVDEDLTGTSAEGQGMGVMLQLGPQWLAKYGNIANTRKLIANVFDQFAIFGIREPAKYPARLNRIDITLDVEGLNVKEISIDEWRRGWVGYAKQKRFHDSPLDGQLEGFSIGSAEGAVRFKIYDKVAESAASGKSRFWRSVWGLPDDTDAVVGRLEWSVRAYSASFASLRYVTDLTYLKFLELLNYVSVKWGRLCVPQADTNRSRWQVAPMWAATLAMIDEWTFDYDEQAKRQYEMRPDLKPSYVKFIAGSLGGLMARIGIEERDDGPASLFDAISFIEGEGLSLTRKAHDKWNVLSKLVTKDGDNE